MSLRKLKKQYKKLLTNIYGTSGRKQYIFLTEKTNDKLNRFEFTYYLFKGKPIKNPYDFYGRYK
jgi:hypothetical protein